ncbi:MAG: substrate-binding domain-containing protein [Chloroflexota bacterium]
MYSPGRFILTVALALAGCASPTIPATTPTTNSAELVLLSTTATSRLLGELTREYAVVRGGLVFSTGEGNHQSLMDRVRNAETPAYFLSTHPPTESDLWAAPVALDSIAVIVNPANPIRDLSLDQLRSIYRGRIANWRELNAGEGPVTVFSREDGSGTRIEFENLLMGERQTIQSAQVAPSSIAMLERIGAEVNGIGYVAGSMVADSVRPVAVDGVASTPENIASSTYPLRTTVFIIGKAEPNGEFRMFVSWVQSPAGQAVVARRHAPLLP